jgi:TPR repeat protein
MFFFFSDFHIKALLIGALLAPYIYAQSSPDAQTFQSDAAQGNAKAQYNLGLCYYEGKGVSRSDSEAVFWWHKAAEQGLDRAQFNLGNHYYFGEGVELDYKEAVYWYKKAAEQDYAPAQCNLGDCYYYGDGVEQNYEKAKMWHDRAKENGEELDEELLQEMEEAFNP